MTGSRHMPPLEEQLERIEGEERQAIEDLNIDLPEIPEGDSNEDEERERLYDRARLLGADRALPQGTGQRLAKPHSPTLT